MKPDFSMPLSYVQVLADTPDDYHKNVLFQKYHRELMPFFREKPWPNWQATIKATREPGSLPSSEGTNPDKQMYMYVFEIQDYNSLPYLHGVLRDSVTYNAMSHIVQSETQTFTSALPYHPQVLDPKYTLPSDTEYLLFMSIDIQNNWQKVLDLRSFMSEPGKGSPMQTKYKFSLAAATFGQSGQKRRLFFTWATPSASPKAEEAVNWLSEQAPVKDILSGPIQWWLWTPLS